MAIQLWFSFRYNTVVSCLIMLQAAALHWAWAIPCLLSFVGFWTMVNNEGLGAEAEGERIYNTLDWRQLQEGTEQKSGVVRAWRADDICKQWSNNNLTSSSPKASMETLLQPPCDLFSAETTGLWVPTKANPFKSTVLIFWCIIRHPIRDGNG